jgi:WhiB family redox-sensing transcriptional regulator
MPDTVTGMTAWDVRNPSRARLDERIPSKLQADDVPEGEFSIPEPTGLDNDWMRRAACLDHEPEVFFPPGPSAYAHIAQARAVCRDCPVVRDCLRVALADPTLVGVWGGTSEVERAELRRRRDQRSAARDQRDRQGLVWIST